MSSELEDGGALMSAGLVASQIDALQPAAAAGSHGHAGTACANCGALLAGAYCHACGQSSHVHRSLLHLVEEVLHGVLHFETKAWRTLPLLVARPGILTRRYIDGQRTRYVSPLALFLFMVFLLFFVMSFTTAEHQGKGAKGADRASVLAELTQNVADSQEEVREATRDLEKARREADDVASAETELAAAQAAEQMAQKALADFGAAARAEAPKAPAPGGAAAGKAAAGDPGTGNAAAADEPKDDWRTQLARQRIDTGHPQLDETIRRQLRNPDLFLYKLKGTASKFSFLLIPISLPFLSLMFLFRRDVSVYDHAVFSLYSLSFMSFFFSAIGVLILAGITSAVGLLMLVVPPLHMFVQLRGAYGLDTIGALWRTAALLCVAGTAFVIFLLLVVLAAAR